MKQAITHNANEDISEDIRSNQNPEDDVEGREKVVSHSRRVLVNVEPVIECEQLEERDQRRYD